MSGMEARRIFKLIGGNIFPVVQLTSPFSGRKIRKFTVTQARRIFTWVQQHIVTDCRLHRRCWWWFLIVRMWDIPDGCFFLKCIKARGYCSGHNDTLLIWREGCISWRPIRSWLCFKHFLVCRIQFSRLPCSEVMELCVFCLWFIWFVYVMVSCLFMKSFHHRILCCYCV